MLWRWVCFFSELHVILPTIIKPKCIILSPIPLGGKKWAKIRRQMYKVSVPKLYIKMKKFINANQFLVSVRSGLAPDYSEGGTKFCKMQQWNFTLIYSGRLKQSQQHAQARGRQCHSQNDNMGASEPQSCWRSSFYEVILQKPIRTGQKGIN